MNRIILKIKKHLKNRTLFYVFVNKFNNLNLYDRFLKNKIVGFINTKYNLIKNAKKTIRLLEIGSGNLRISNFETLDITGGANVDYVIDISKKLPFKDETFDLIYASHILEHIAWYLCEDVMLELVRVLKPGGKIEIFVPDGFKIAKILIDYELNGVNNIHLDGWLKFNDNKNLYKWVAGRLFTYGDGTGSINHPNWHRGIFTARSLKNLFNSVGLTEIKILNNSDARGYDHGWINLGITGKK